MIDNNSSSNYLIDSMTWSHSRIGSYEQCPYGFYLKYIDGCEEAPMFFSDFGSLVHDILARYYGGKITREAAESEYLIRFPAEVRGKAPSHDIRVNYFAQGLLCMRALSPIPGKILGIEEYVRFRIFDLQFIGFIDLIYTDEHDKLIILDHKSRTLRPRSKRRKPTKTDEELDSYLRQLYMYAIPVKEMFGRYPDYLEFNCYRSGERIKEEFHTEALEATKEWAVGVIDRIRAEKEWNPDMEFWKCNNICGLHDQCEYAQMGF